MNEHYPIHSQPHRVEGFAQWLALEGPGIDKGSERSFSTCSLNLAGTWGEGGRGGFIFTSLSFKRRPSLPSIMNAGQIHSMAARVTTNRNQTPACQSRLWQTCLSQVQNYVVRYTGAAAPRSSYLHKEACILSNHNFFSLLALASFLILSFVLKIALSEKGHVGFRSQSL